MTAHHGLAVGDANGDGLDDVYACRPGGMPNLLLIHKNDGTVVNEAAKAGRAKELVGFALERGMHTAQGGAAAINQVTLSTLSTTEMYVSKSCTAV